MPSKPHYEANLDDARSLDEPQEDSKDIQFRKKGSRNIQLGPRAFNIVWGRDNRYWHIPDEISNSPGDITDERYAELIQVSWLEVTSVVEIEKGHTYKISFNLSLKEGAFGWNSPVFLMAKIGNRGNYFWKRLRQLEQKAPWGRTDVPSDNPFTIYVPDDVPDNRLFFGLYEVWSGKWKGGLKIHGASVQLFDQSAATQPQPQLPG